MATRLHQFAVTKETHEDYQQKTVKVNLLKQLKTEALAGSAVAAYRLAKIYPQHSEPFMKWMKIAIDQGLTNAMLDMAKIFTKKGSVGHLQQAASYLLQILRSDDSYIKTLAQDFLKDNRPLLKEISRQINQPATRLSFVGFFARDTKPTDAHPPLVDNCLNLN